MNKAVKIGLITLATISVMTVGVVIFKKKLSKKALPPTVQNVELTPEAKAILTEANNYVGIKEVGDNAGFSDADFEKKMKNIGWVKGRAYCVINCHEDGTFECPHCNAKGNYDNALKKQSDANMARAFREINNRPQRVFL